MKKWLKSLSKEQIQRYVFVGLLVLVFVAFFVSLSIASSNEKNQGNTPPIENPDNGQNNNNNNNNNIQEGEDPNNQNPSKPTIEKIGMPMEGDFVVVRKYYDKNDTTENQELSVIQFGKRYYTSNGIGLSSKEKTNFNVLAALSGEVVSVDESPIYGVVVTLKHENNIHTEYGSLSEATVSVGEVVSQGDVIGVSGVCEYDSTLESHVYFKVMSGTKTYNPENVIGKTIEEITK